MAPDFDKLHSYSKDLIPMHAVDLVALASEHVHSMPEGQYSCRKAPLCIACVADATYSAGYGYLRGNFRLQRRLLFVLLVLYLLISLKRTFQLPTRSSTFLIGVPAHSSFILPSETYLYFWLWK